ncbi:MAG: hypothetical protein KIT31_04385 [Deltaproteobacteria bacterium]|nr:hypothetical protein [Deltaproteobacteria bacterium]
MTTRAETKTGDRGYFRLEVPAERGRLPTTSEGTEPTPSPRVTLLLVVSDGRRDLLADKTPTLVRPGRTVYRELELAPTSR